MFLIVNRFGLLFNLPMPINPNIEALQPSRGTLKMHTPENKNLYSLKDTLQVMVGIPVVMAFAIFCANFATSYAGI